MDSNQNIGLLRRTLHRRSAIFVLLALVLPGLAIFFQNQLDTSLAPFPVPLVWVSLCFVAAVRAATSAKQLRNALLDQN